MTDPGHPTAPSRRRLLAGAAAIAAPACPVIEGSALMGTASVPGSEGDTVTMCAVLDGPLVVAASAFCDLERRMLALIEGPGRIDDDELRDRALEPLRGEQLRHLDALCRLEARTMTEHVARALAFLLWDGGELANRAEMQVSLEDRLLWSLVRDLAAMPC